MQKLFISEDDNKRRLDKYLVNLFPGAGFGFLQKMLRKKNITVNGKKASGNQTLKAGDTVEIFFSHETFTSLKGEEDSNREFYELKELSTQNIEFPYEDDELLVVNKPFGMLSQKSHRDDISVNEVARAYLIQKGELTPDSFNNYKPSIVNRLDRNTGGLIIVSKTRAGAVRLSSLIKDKKIRRIYNAICHGDFKNTGIHEAYYLKDHDKNTAMIFDSKKDGSSIIKTRFDKISFSAPFSLIEAELYTGKSHQIRIMSAKLGHPLLNDEKYGDSNKDKSVKDISLPGQYLFARKVIFPDGRVIEIPLPKEFKRIIEDK